MYVDISYVTNSVFNKINFKYNLKIQYKLKVSIENEGKK